MDSDTLQDLKQFIEATVSQQLAGAVDELREDNRLILKETIDELREEMDEKHNEVLNALGGTVAEQNTKLADHETRITRLEHA